MSMFYSIFFSSQFYFFYQQQPPQHSTHNNILLMIRRILFYYGESFAWENILLLENELGSYFRMLPGGKEYLRISNVENISNFITDLKHGNYRVKM